MTEQPPEQPTAAPERGMLNVHVPPATKASLIAEAERENISLTKLLENAGAYLQDATLKRLLPHDRPLYLNGNLRADEAFGHKLGPPKRDPSAPTAVINAAVTVVAREQLRRYADFYGYALADVFGVYARNIDKRFKRRPPPEGGPGPDPSPEQAPQRELEAAE